MKFLKKTMALVLAVAMVLGLMVFPVAAAEKFTVSVDSANANAGETVKVNLNLSNNTGMNSLTVRVYYKSDILTCTSANARKDAAGNDSAWEVYGDTCDNAPNVSTNKDDKANISDERKNAGWKMASFGYAASTDAAFADNGAIGCLTFTVAGDVESCETPIEVEIVKVTDGSDADIDAATANGKLTIKGVTPTIDTVTLANDSVNVVGGNAAAQTVQATAKSVKGTDITGGVAWTVAPADKGVSISEAGVISVTAKAVAGTYTISAGAKGDTAQGEAKTATLTVTRSNSVPTSIVFNNPPAEIIVPVDEASDTALSVTVFDQFDAAMGGNRVFSVVPAGEGVSMVGSSVRVAPEAKNAVLDTTGKVYTVSVYPEGMPELTETVDITVKRAASVATDVEIYLGESAANDTMITIPLSGEKTVEFTAKVFDQYGAEMPNANAQFTLEGTPIQGTSRNNGTFTVTAAAATGEVTLVASYNGITDSVKITVSKLNIDWTAVGITTKNNPTYGDTNDDIINDIAATSVSYNTDGSDVYGETLTGTFSVVDATAVQNAGEQSITVKFTASDDAANGEYKGAEFTTTVPVTIAKKVVTVSGITAKNKVYDKTTAVELDCSAAVFAGIVAGDELSITATGAFADVNAGTGKTVNLSGLTLGGADVDNYELAAEGNQTAATADIAPKAISVTANDATKVYGEANPTFDFTVDAGALVSDDTKDDLSVALNSTADTTTDVGSVEITGNDGDANDNYEITVVPGTLTITAKSLTVTAGTLVVSKSYDGTTAPGTAQAGTELGLEGVINNDTVTVAYTTIGDYVDANVGTGKAVTISGLSLSGADAANYSITATEQNINTGVITKADVTADMLQFTPVSVVYDGTAKSVTISLKDNKLTGLGVGTVLYNGAAEAVNAGDYTVTVSFAEGDNFNAAADLDLGIYTIEPKNISGVTVEGIDPNGYEFSGSEIKPVVTVKDGEIELTDADYSVAYSDNVNVGNSAKITITGKGNYTGTKEVLFKITKTQPKLGTDYTVTLPVNPVYDGTAKEAVVNKTNDGIGTPVVKYNGSTTAPVAAGTYAVTVDIPETENYAGMTDVACGSFTIAKAKLQLSAATVADKTYNGKKDDAVVTAVTFTGLQNNEELVLGTDFTASGEYASADADPASAVTVTVTLSDTAKANNYELDGNTVATTGKVDKTVTTLEIAAADAAYTGVNYAESNITKTSNVEDTVNYTYYSDEECTVPATPVNVGTYWVKGAITETKNASAAEATASFKITKAPLTIKANDHTIVYGAEPTNAGVTYTGFVNNETEAVVTGLVYEYNYEQFDNVGTYVITPKAAVADNYEISFETGKLTVEQKEAALTWSIADGATLYYNAEAQNVSAIVNNLETADADKVEVVVVGGANIACGSYTAKAVSLSGAKALNYKLPEAVTLKYSIVPALTSVTVAPETVTAVIDGLTIKLVGYVKDMADLKIDGNAIPEDGVLVYNGVEYTVDVSGVAVIPENVEIVNGNPVVPAAPSEDAAEAGVTQEVVDDLSESPKADGLNSAAGGMIVEEAAAAADSADKPEETETIVIESYLHIDPLAYVNDGENHSLKLSVTPWIKISYKDAEGNVVGESVVKPVDNSDVNAVVTVNIKLPAGMTTANLYAKLDLGNGTYAYLPVTVNNGVASWQQTSFGIVELISDARTATVTYLFEDGSAQNDLAYTAENLGETLPTDYKAGYIFGGWVFTAGEEEIPGTYTVLTDELLSALNGKADVTAKASFSAPYYPGTPSTPNKPNNPFEDVEEEDYFYDAVLWAVENGITKGTTATTFSPELECTRAQMVTFLWRAAGCPAATISENPFADVTADAYYYDAVLWAVEKGITAGVTATSFAPDAVCTRAQMATFLWRFEGKPVVSGNNAFTDVAADAYYYDAVLWAAQRGITVGTTETTFSPDAACTRGQMVTFLYRNAEAK